MNNVIWYEDWKKQHPGEQRLMLEEVGRNPKAIYIPLKKNNKSSQKADQVYWRYQEPRSFVLRGNDVTWKTPIFMFKLCKTGERFEDTLQHKCSGSLKDTKNQIGLSGFNKQYTRKDELEDALENAEYSLPKFSFKFIFIKTITFKSD